MGDIKNDCEIESEIEIFSWLFLYRIVLSIVSSVSVFCLLIFLMREWPAASFYVAVECRAMYVG